MNNALTLDLEETNARVNEHLIKGVYREKNRRSRAIKIVKYLKSKLKDVYPPLTALKYLSALFRQRGVPSMDMFTMTLVGSFKSGRGLDPEVDGPVRKILSMGQWVSTNSYVTMWTIEPTISTVLVENGFRSINIRWPNHSFSEPVICSQYCQVPVSDTVATTKEPASKSNR